MFGIFKQREINHELLRQNVVDAILATWANENKLHYAKFQSFAEISRITNPNEDVLTSFMTEKLRFIASVAITLLEKIDIDKVTIAQILDEVSETVKSVDVPELKKSGENLKQKASEYTEIRLSANPRIAGKMIEDYFSKQAFGFSPSESSIDQRYTLYKSLSSFERSTILEISNAVRSSKI